MKKIIAVVMVSLFLLTACKDDPAVVERPLYPAEGAINARYSVGDTVTVVFAQGNLQYQAATHIWRFARNQYDVIGVDNQYADTAYSGWIDLIGWGTSGFGGLMPYTIHDTSEVYAYGQYQIGGSDYDWGQYNPISNGGNEAGRWRTLTYDEWTYLLKYRTDAHHKRAMGTIENVGVQGAAMHGMILLPDKWELPEGCTFQHGIGQGYETNVYDAAQWNRMQGAGAVFLPAGGERSGTEVSMVGDYGCYWTADGYTLTSAYEFYFLSSGYDFYTTARASGHSVRLVMER